MLPTVDGQRAKLREFLHKGLNDIKYINLCTLPEHPFAASPPSQVINYPVKNISDVEYFPPNVRKE